MIPRLTGKPVQHIFTGIWTPPDGDAPGTLRLLYGAEGVVLSQRQIGNFNLPAGMVRVRIELRSIEE